MNIMMNAVFTDLLEKMPGPSKGKGKALQVGSFADFLKKGMAKDAVADNNILGANTSVKKKISTVAKPVAEPGLKKKTPEQEEALSVAAIMQEFMNKLQDVAKKVEPGPGQWTLTPGNKDLLRKLGRSAGMQESELQKLMNRMEQKSDGLLVPDFLGALSQNFAEQQKEHKVQVPETELPLLETFLARMGVQVEKIAASSSAGVSGDSKLDLNLYLEGLNKVEGTDAITLSDWEGEQLQDLLRQAGASEQLLKQLLPEKSTAAAAARVLSAVDGKHLAAVESGAEDGGGKIELSLDRLKSMLAKAIAANDASQPKADVVPFLTNLEKVLEQAGFQDKTVGWSPVVQESIVKVYKELQKMVDASLEKDDGASARKIVQDIFRSAFAMKEAKVLAQNISENTSKLENRQVLPPGKIYRSDYAFGVNRVAEQTAASASAGKTATSAPAGIDSTILASAPAAETAIASMRVALARLANLANAPEAPKPQAMTAEVNMSLDPAVLEQLAAPQPATVPANQSSQANQGKHTTKAAPANAVSPTKLENLFSRAGFGPVELKQLNASAIKEKGVDPAKLLVKLSSPEANGPIVLNEKEVKFLQDVLNRAGIDKKDWPPVLARQNTPAPASLPQLAEDLPQLDNILSRLGMPPEEIKQLAVQFRAGQPVNLEQVLARLQDNEDQGQALALTETETEFLQDVFKRAETLQQERQPQADRDNNSTVKFDEQLAGFKEMARSAMQEIDAGSQARKAEAILQEISGFLARPEIENSMASEVPGGAPGLQAVLAEEIAAIRQELGQALQPPANRGKIEDRLSTDNGLAADQEIDGLLAPTVIRAGSASPAAAELQAARQPVLPRATGGQVASAANPMSAHGKGTESDFASRFSAEAEKAGAGPQNVANSAEAALAGKDASGDTVLEKRPLPAAIFSDSQSAPGKNDLAGFFPEERRGVEQAASIANRPAPPTARPGPEWQQQVFTQLSQSVARGLQNKEHHLVLKLYPEDLGKVDIKLAIKNGHVSINFGMENSQVKEILENNMGQFRDNLSKHGFILDGCQVSVGNQEQNREKYEQSEFVAGPSRKKGKVESVMDLPDEMLYRHQVDRYGRDQNISVIA